MVYISDFPVLPFCAIKTMRVSFVKRAVAGEVRLLLNEVEFQHLAGSVMYCLYKYHHQNCQAVY